MHAQAKVTSE